MVPPPAAPAGAMPPPGGAPSTAADAARPKSDWTEHTAPDGRKYYYNAKLGKSSWEKPEELMSDKEKVDARWVGWGARLRGQEAGWRWVGVLTAAVVSGTKGEQGVGCQVWWEYMGLMLGGDARRGMTH